jgi:hypothetical protein
MNDQELLEWGIKENRLRQEDIARVFTKKGLRQVQSAAKQRRLVVHLSAGQAASAVIDAQHELERMKRITKDRRKEG